MPVDRTARRPILQAMRMLTVAFGALLAVSGLNAAAFAASAEGDGSTRQTLAPPAETRAEKLAALFETLKTASDEGAARTAENGIFEIWMDSGSPTIDVLMQWTMKAMDEENFPLALDFLDRVTSLKPDYIEGWNKRATVFFLTDDYGKAVADLERVLALEPRHFGALAGLGQILREIGDDKRALKAFQAALDIDPHMTSVVEAIDELNKEDGGHDL